MDKKQSRTLKRLTVLLIILIMAVLLFFWWRMGRSDILKDTNKTAGTTMAVASIDSITHRSINPDSALGARTRALSHKTADRISRINKIKKTDTMKISADSLIDSFGASTVLEEDTTGISLAQNRPALTDCEKDTMQPWAYPVPSGGLHRQIVHMAFETNKPCSLYWRLSGASADWQSYRGDTIAIKINSVVEYYAIDSCGWRMETRSESYEFALSKTVGPCGNDMEMVALGSTRFCIDKYEWPNRKGILPRAFVSYYNAADSCAVAGKRLCTAEEWSLACSGPSSSTYPYGNAYERRACVTEDTAAHPAGSSPECRGYFEVFDMAGNLLEWTSTKNRTNRSFYNVLGGFYESGKQSRCFDERYSYYPQNRHNPVGFRCCKNVTTVIK